LERRASLQLPAAPRLLAQLVQHIRDTPAIFELARDGERLFEPGSGLLDVAKYAPGAAKAQQSLHCFLGDICRTRDVERLGGRGPAQAQALLEECHVLWRESGTRMGERAAVMNLALVTLERGALTRSAGLARESLELSQDMRDDGSATAARCVEIAAQVLGVLASMPTAVTLLASATTRREALGAPRPSVERPELDRLLDAAHKQLAASVFEIAWRRGEDLPIHDAIDLAAASLTTLLETRSR
jgi:hypothetical protein